jgi:hypothetical protein
VSAQTDAVFSAEVGDAVGIVEVELALTGFCGLRFHIVLRRDTVEVLENESLLFRVGNVALVDSYANGEIVFVGILEPLCPSAGATRKKEHGQESEFLHELLSFLRF